MIETKEEAKMICQENLNLINNKNKKILEDYDSNNDSAEILNVTEKKNETEVTNNNHVYQKSIITPDFKFKIEAKKSE